MITHKQDGQVIFQGPGAKGFLLHSANQCEYVRLEIDGGAGIDRHQLPMPASFYVISGQGQLQTDIETINAVAGDLIEVSANMPRVWHNSSTERLVLLVIKHLE